MKPRTIERFPASADGIPLLYCLSFGNFDFAQMGVDGPETVRMVEDNHISIRGEPTDDRHFTRGHSANGCSLPDGNIDAGILRNGLECGMFLRAKMRDNSAFLHRPAEFSPFAFKRTVAYRGCGEFAKPRIRRGPLFLDAIRFDQFCDEPFHLLCRFKLSLQLFLQYALVAADRFQMLSAVGGKGGQPIFFRPFLRNEPSFFAQIPLEAGLCFF